MIPIRPTAVAANDDMGVMVWVLGESRAVPVNYKALELNQALINWLNGARNYNQVVIAAANEAGGQGFVRERAGPSEDYDDVVVFDSKRRLGGAPNERRRVDRIGLLERSSCASAGGMAIARARALLPPSRHDVVPGLPRVLPRSIGHSTRKRSSKLSREKSSSR